MSSTRIIVLIVVTGVYAYLVLGLWRAVPYKTPLQAVLHIALLLAFGAQTTIGTLPYRTIELQPAGTLVALQARHGSGTIVETSTAFYTVRGGFTADKGEVLELRVREHPVYRVPKPYLCSAHGCSALAG